MPFTAATGRAEQWCMMTPSFRDTVNELRDAALWGMKMIRQNTAAYHRVVFRLRQPASQGVTELERYLSAMRKNGKIKRGRRHVGFGNDGRDFVIDFEELMDGTLARLSW